MTSKDQTAHLIPSEDMWSQKIQHTQYVREDKNMLLIGELFGLEVHSASQLCSYHGQVPGKGHKKGPLTTGTQFIVTTKLLTSFHWQACKLCSSSDINQTDLLFIQYR